MTTQMYTYSIQNIQGGETFVIEWDGDDVHGVCGPLHYTEVETAATDIENAGSFEYDTDSFKDADWGFPIATYDPNTGEVYRA